MQEMRRWEGRAMRKSFLDTESECNGVWKAVCRETCPHSLGRGRRKRAEEVPRRRPTSFAGGRSEKDCPAIPPGTTQAGLRKIAVPRRPPTLHPSWKPVHCSTCRSTSETTRPYESVGTDDWRRLSAASDLQRAGSRERNGYLDALYVSRGEMRDRLQAARLMATESPEDSTAWGNAPDRGKGDRWVTVQRLKGTRCAVT